MLDFWHGDTWPPAPGSIVYINGLTYVVGMSAKHPKDDHYTVIIERNMVGGRSQIVIHSDDVEVHPLAKGAIEGISAIDALKILQLSGI